MNFSPIHLKGDPCVYKDQALTLNCVPILFGNIVIWLLAFAGIAAVLFIIIGGFKFMTSNGDSKKTEEAKKTITFAVIGLILIFMSFSIVGLIGYMTGVTCIDKFGFKSCKEIYGPPAPTSPAKPKNSPLKVGWQ